MTGFVYSEKPIDVARGEGPHLYSADGTEYLDFGATYGVSVVGHCHPEVVAAAQAQLEELVFVHATYPNEVRTGLFETLADLAPGALDNVWLCNSGTEANEAALKFARHATGRSKIVAANRAFHGRTMGSLAATWKQKYRERYGPLAGDFEFVPFGDEEALADAVDRDTAALLLEPVQGEGGVRPAPPGYLQAARDAVDDADAALVFDEIQTGLGRTGTLWACQNAGVVPDVLTTAKGLAGGLPMGATLCADWIAASPGNHGSTFAGGPVVSAAAQATLDVVVEEDLAANAAAVGDHFLETLEAELPDTAREVRGEGLMVGVEVRRGASRVLKELAMDHQVLATPAGRTVVRFLPPLTIDEGHADEVAAALAEVLS